MSLGDIHYEEIKIPGLEKVLNKLHKSYTELKRVYNEKYKKDYDIRVVINGENNITIITSNGSEEEYTYCYKED